jgi:heme oxygenase
MTILGDITRQKHTEVENLPLLQTLLKGQVDKDGYVFYLYDLFFIYERLEKLAKETGVWNGLEGMERTEMIRKDLEELSPGYTKELCESTKEYLQYLDSLASDENRKHLIMSHIYVRHTGDMYGGKLLARLVPGSGYAYQFDDRPGLIKKINAKLSLELADEANYAFEWFIQIFSEMGEKLGYANIQISK